MRAALRIKMTIVLVPSLRTAVLACVAAVAAQGAPQQFRTGIDVVRLPVVVTGRDGKPVHGLTAADFEVKEQGQPQQIAYFAEGFGGDPLPLHLGLLLDTSDSMENDLKDAADAAVRFVRAMEEAEDTTFVDFDTAVRVGRFEPPSYPTLFERIRSRKTKGFTALFDALGVYLESALHRDGQHVLVMFTDGGDTMSRMNYSTLQDLLRVGNVVVYALGYLENQLSSARLTQQTRLTQIAQETGGEAFFPSSRDEIDRLYARIRDDLLFRYTLGYVPAASASDAKFRKIEVKLTRPDLRGAKVRARSGYLARR
jgi:Ca-activated chloride channel homolog